MSSSYLHQQQPKRGIISSPPPLSNRNIKNRKVSLGKSFIIRRSTMVQNITDCIGRWIYWIRRAQEIYATEFNLHLWRGWPSRCCGNLRPQRINNQLFIILTVRRSSSTWRSCRKIIHIYRGISLCRIVTLRGACFRRFLFFLRGCWKEETLVTCCFVMFVIGWIFVINLYRVYELTLTHRWSEIGWKVINNFEISYS